MSDTGKIDWQAVYSRLRVSERKLAEALSPNPERVRQIQAERAAYLASRKANQAAEKTTPMLIARIGGETLAVSLTAIAEVTRIKSLTYVAGAPAEVLGVINLHGELYSVIEATSSRRTGQESDEIAWGIVLRHSSLRIVIGVQSILRTENVPCSFLRNVEGNVLRIHNEIAVVLDTQAILERMAVESASSTRFHNPS